MLMTKEKTNAPPLYIPARRSHDSQQPEDFPVTSFRHASENAMKHRLTFVWGNGESEIKEISGVWKMSLHRRWEVEFCQVWKIHAPKLLSERDDTRMGSTFLNTNLGCARLGLLLSGSLFGLLHAPYLW